MKYQTLQAHIGHRLTVYYSKDLSLVLECKDDKATLKTSRKPKNEAP